MGFQLNNLIPSVYSLVILDEQKYWIKVEHMPPYSPDLNPIEQIWRCIRRKISQIFVKSEYSFLETIRTTFYRLAKKTSFMDNWLKKIQSILLKYL